jgi:4-amino-4-deoxy-L-arabinose transferase-like glycosyltransferase
MDPPPVFRLVFELSPLWFCFGLGYFLFQGLAARHWIAKDRRISWAFTMLLMGFLYVFIAEGAGAMHRLTRGTVLALWLVADAGLLAAVVWMRKPTPAKIIAGVKERWRRFSPRVAMKPPLPLWNPALLVLVCAMILLVGAVALECPATVRDALTYHVPRVMHWLQQRSLSPYPTSIVRQLESAPGAELQTATLMLLTGDDWALNLPQWWALLTCGLLASLLTERLMKWHFGRQQLDGARVAWCGLFAALIVVTLPAVVPQAISSLNDLLSAQWVMLLVVFGLLLTQEPGNYVYASGMGGALALGITNKPTMFIYAAPFVAALSLWLLRKSLRMLAVLGAVTVVLGLAANVPWMRRNYQVFNNPLGSEETRRAQGLADYAPTKMAANVIRNLSLYTDTPFDWSTSLLKHVLSPGIKLLGETPDDKGSVWAGTAFTFPLRGSVVKRGDGFGGMMVVLPVLLAGLFFVWKFKWKSPVLIYMGLVLAGFALFCGYLRWQPWHQRLHLPLFMLAAPFVGMVLGWAWKRWVVLVVSLLLVLNALLILYYLPPYPIRLLTERSTPTREGLYFSQRPELYEGMAELAHDLVITGTTNVCLYIGPDTWEYQFWVCLKNRGFHGTIQHVFVGNESAMLAGADLDSPGTAVLCSDEVNVPLLSEFGLRVSYDRWAAYYRGKPEMRDKLVANQKIFSTHFNHPTLLQMRCNPVDQNGLPITNNVIRMQVGDYARDFPITSEQVLLEWHFPAGSDKLTVYCVNPLSTNQRIMTLANFQLRYIPDGN